MFPLFNVGPPGFGGPDTPVAEPRLGRAYGPSRIGEGFARSLMVGNYLAALAAEGGWILWVGCRADLRAAHVALEAGGGVLWTMDRDPLADRWGRPGRHRTGEVERADEVFATLRFTSIVCSGVFDHCPDDLARQRRALHALSRLLFPGGRLLLQRRAAADGPAFNPDGLEGLVPRPFAGQPPRAHIDGCVFDTWVRLR